MAGLATRSFRCGFPGFEPSTPLLLRGRWRASPGEGHSGLDRPVGRSAATSSATRGHPCRLHCPRTGRLLRVRDYVGGARHPPRDPGNPGLQVRRQGRSASPFIRLSGCPAVRLASLVADWRLAFGGVVSGPGTERIMLGVVPSTGPVPFSRCPELCLAAVERAGTRCRPAESAALRSRGCGGPVASHQLRPTADDLLYAPL